MLLLLIILVIFSLGLSAVLAFEGFRLHRLLMTLGGSVRQNLAQTAKDMGALRAGRLEMCVPVKQEVPVKLRVPFRHKMEVPVSTSVAVRQDVKTTVDVQSLGFSVPLDVTVPLDLEVPVEVTVPVEINRSVSVTAKVPIDFSMPVEVELGEAGLDEHLARVQADLLALDSALAAAMDAAPRLEVPARMKALASAVSRRTRAAAPKSSSRRPAKRPAPCPDCD